MVADMGLTDADRALLLAAWFPQPTQGRRAIYARPCIFFCRYSIAKAIDRVVHE